MGNQAIVNKMYTVDDTIEYELIEGNQFAYLRLI